MRLTDPASPHFQNTRCLRNAGKQALATWPGRGNLRKGISCSSKVVRSKINQRFFFKFDFQLEGRLCKINFLRVAQVLCFNSPFMKAKFTDFLKAKDFLRTKVQRISEDFSETRRTNHKEKRAN